MRTLYIDCGMGAAGDMLSAALTELLPDPDGFVDELNHLGIPGVRFVRELSTKCGIRGSHMSVLVDEYEEGAHGHSQLHDHGHRHVHNGMEDIRSIIASLTIPENVRNDVLSVYALIAEAESAVHGIPVEEIHLHEVGALDAVADVTAVCLLIDRLSPDEILASPICTGFGSVHAAHGILPVPAPATARLLMGLPAYGGELEGELCTPTGAALLRLFVNSFGSAPVMRAEAIGYGMGKKDFPRANCVRVTLGERADSRCDVSVLSCNIDDMTAEEIGFAAERLLESGARDVYTIPIGMKKGRPGIMLQVICDPDESRQMAERMLRYTTTLGVRETEMSRTILPRGSETRRTAFGDVRVKIAEGLGVSREKIEYDDLARIAREQDLSLADAHRLLENEVI